jgi:hypothetical protein
MIIAQRDKKKKLLSVVNINGHQIKNKKKPFLIGNIMDRGLTFFGGAMKSTRISQLNHTQPGVVVREGIANFAERHALQTHVTAKSL